MATRRTAADYPFFDNGGRPVVFAHRGGSQTGFNIENTMQAFRNCVELGCTHLESDVQATGDGRLVLFHDATLDRMVGRPGRISELPWSAVSRLKVRGVEPIPLLSDLLEEWPEVKVNVDAKSRSTIEPLAKVIRDQRAWDRICVASFSPLRMAQLRSVLGTQVASGLTPLGVAVMKFVGVGQLREWLLRHSGPVLQVPLRRGPIPILSRAFIDDVHASRRHVHVWTIDDPTVMHRLLDLGVDGIMTDRVDTARDVFADRGIWPEPPL